jgi:hypothetical protein
VVEEAREAGETWNEVRSLATNRTRWSSFTMSYAPEGARGTKKKKKKKICLEW